MRRSWLGALVTVMAASVVGLPAAAQADVTQYGLHLPTVSGNAVPCVLDSGQLSRARSCRRPLTLSPRGTSRWSLALRLRVPRGVYRISVTAADARGVHSRTPAVARMRVR